MKKLVALIMAGALLAGMTVSAAGSSTAGGSDPSQPAPTAAPAEAVTSEGFPAAVVSAAQDAGMSVGEYVNNAIVTVPGITDATPVCQGGHVIINGAPSNFTFTLRKAKAAAVSSAKAQAAVLGGKVMNVVEVKGPVKNFATARVTFCSSNTSF